MNGRVSIVPEFSEKRRRKDKRVPMNSTVLEIIKERLSMNIGAKSLFVNPRTGTRFYSIDKAWNTVLKIKIWAPVAQMDRAADF